MRVWYESGTTDAAWRGSIENTATGSRRYFTDYGTLTAFLALESKPD